MASTYGRCEQCDQRGELFAAHGGKCSYCFHSFTSTITRRRHDPPARLRIRCTVCDVPIVCSDGKPFTEHDDITNRRCPWHPIDAAAS
jgi:hypothetical protein